MRNSVAAAVDIILEIFAIVKEHSFLYVMHVKGVARAGLGVLQILYSG